MCGPRSFVLRIVLVADGIRLHEPLRITYCSAEPHYHNRSAQFAKSSYDSNFKLRLSSDTQSQCQHLAGVLIIGDGAFALHAKPTKKRGTTQKCLPAEKVNTQCTTELHRVSGIFQSSTSNRRSTHGRAEEKNVYADMVQSQCNVLDQVELFTIRSGRSRKKKR